MPKEARALPVKSPHFRAKVENSFRLYAEAHNLGEKSRCRFPAGTADTGIRTIIGCIDRARRRGSPVAKHRLALFDKGGHALDGVLRLIGQRREVGFDL